MKILITGGAGFIGSHLHSHYENLGHEVISIDNFMHACLNPLNSRVKYADVRYYHDIENYVKWADVVFHLAAQIHVDKSITNPQETLDINVGGTLNVLEAVKKFCKKMVFASSSEVYGTSKNFAMPMDEQHPLDCQGPYAASKVAGDRLCYSYWKTYGTKVAILRNFNTFGEYQNDTSYGGVIAIFTRNALQEKPLKVYGDGKQERDYMHVKDAIRGYEFCLTNGLWGRPVNIGSGRTVTINSLAEMIKKFSNSNSKIIHVKPRPGEVLRLCADTTYVESKGFKSTTDFNIDLKNYVSWYRRNQMPKVSDKGRTSG